MFDLAAALFVAEFWVAGAAVVVWEAGAIVEAEDIFCREGCWQGGTEGLRLADVRRVAHPRRLKGMHRYRSAQKHTQIRSSLIRLAKLEAPNWQLRTPANEVDPQLSRNAEY